MRFFTIILALIIYSSASAQQEPLLKHSDIHPFLMNPAMTGSEDFFQARFIFRDQWTYFPGKPRTYLMSVNGPISNNSGIGLIYLHDIQDPITRNIAKLSYAYELKFADTENKERSDKNDVSLAIGLRAKVMHFNINSNWIRVSQNPDELISNVDENDVTFDFDIGAHFKYNNAYLGVSVNQLLETQVDFTDSEVGAGALERHFYVYAGYKHKMKGGKALQGTVLMKALKGLPTQFDAFLRMFFLDERFMVGVNYKTQKTVGAMFGVKFDNRIHLQYNASINLHAVRQFSVTNELVLGFDFSTSKNKNKWLRIKTYERN